MFSELWKRWMFGGVNKNVRRKSRLKPPCVAPSLEWLERRELLSNATPLYLIESTPTEAVTPDRGGHPTSPPASPPPGFSPSQIEAAYGFNNIPFASYTGSGPLPGTGQTIAIVDAYNDPDIYSNLETFDAQYGLVNPNLTVLNQSGTVLSTNGTSTGAKTPSNNSDWAVEESLDVEWAHAIAPGANIVLVEASSASMSNLLTAVKTASNYSGVSVVSMSWGGDESSGETADDSYFTTPGVTYVAASGDSGAPPIYPATSPNVLAVGGTTLTLNSSGGYGSETAWSDSGGGISAYEPLPSYQPGTYSSGSTTGTSTMRMSPDVSYDANPDTGFAVYDTDGYSGWLEVGGTSDAAPQWAALVSIADQGRALDGEGTLTGSTQTLPMLYQIGTSSSSSTYFHEITSGSNGTYSAGPGYNLVTGLGTPIANQVIDYLVSGSSTSPPPSPPPPSPPPSTPAAPTNLSATPESSSEIYLTWADPSSDTGDTYVVELYNSSTGSYSPIYTTAANATSYTVSGLTPATTYTYEVLADNNGVYSSPSNPASATTSPPPSPPPSSGLLLDGGFESPVLSPGTYVLDPTGTPWSFGGTAGIASNGSSVTGNQSAPQGSQVGFLSGYGSGFVQSVYLSTGTDYTITFDAANAGRAQEIAVAVGGTILAEGTAASTYTSYSTESFYVTASGNYAVEFVGLNSSGGIALIDNVGLAATPMVQQGRSDSSGSALVSLSGNSGLSSTPISVTTTSHGAGSQSSLPSDQLPVNNRDLGLLINLSSPVSLTDQVFAQEQPNAAVGFNSLMSAAFLSPLVTGLRPQAATDPFGGPLDWA